MPPPRQDVDVTNVFSFNVIPNLVRACIQPIMANRGQEIRRSGDLQRSEPANKLLSCEAPITACLPGFLTSGSYYSLSSNPPTLLSSNNQPLTLARKGRKKSASPFTLHLAIKKLAAFTLAEGATHVDTTDNVRHTAFTLAEVLITLGIIGVVAAMTLPALITDYRNSVVETRLKKFYSTMNQAILRSINDNGEPQYWNYFLSNKEDGDSFVNQNDLSAANFQKYLAPYITIVSTKEVTTNNEILMLYYLADGSAFSFAATHNRDIYFYPKNPEKCLLNTKNIRRGKCEFVFNFKPDDAGETWKYLYNKGMEPYLYDWDGDINSLYSGKRYSCDKNGEGHYCTAIIFKNGWKIPQNYPRRISF